MTDYRNTCFTLVEVIVALAILTMGLLAGLSLIASSQQRLTKASKRWHEQHLLTQAAEYFLLTNGSASPPAEVFSDPDYSVRCDWDEPGDLPEGVNPVLGGWKLRTMNVVLSDKDGRVARKIAIDRIMKGTD
jgi:Tfp pilus assembly protein PilV